MQNTTKLNSHSDKNMAGIDVSGFNVPATPYTESNAIPQLAEQLMQKKKHDYMLQKDKEADQLKRLEFINKATDLSKHPTGEAASQGIVNEKVEEMYKKYTSPEYSKMPITEMVYNLNKDAMSTVAYADRMRNELTGADKDLEELRKTQPNLDFNTLKKVIRADIVGRNLDGKGDFNTEVPPTKINLSDQNFLSDYISSTGNLNKLIQSPSGLDDIKVASGNEGQNTVFSGKIPPWAVPNYTKEMLKKGGGYLPRGFVPQLEIESESLPADFLPALKNNPRKMVTQRVYDDFYKREPAEIISGTKKMFGKDNYEKLSEGERVLAQRDFLYVTIKSLDKNDFNYSSGKGPSAAQQKNLNNQGGSGKGNVGDAGFLRMFEGLSGKTEINKTTGFSALSGDEQNMVRGYLSPKDRVDENAIELTKDINGNILVLKNDIDGRTGKNIRSLITTLDKESINTKASKKLGIKSVGAAHSDARQTNTPTTDKPVGKGKPVRKLVLPH